MGAATQTRSNDSYAWNGHYNVGRAYAVDGLNRTRWAGTNLINYDARGNLASSAGTSYYYTSDNKLSQTSTGVYLANDMAGRLVQVYANGGASVTPMDYLGNQLITEMNGSNQLIRRYVHGPGDDAPLVWYEGSGTSDKRWLHADERGSIVAITDTSGNAIAINRYDEYSLPRRRPGAFRPRRTWVGSSIPARLGSRSLACITTRPASTPRRLAGSCRPIRLGMRMA
jgi:hypothetical protein